MNDVNGSSGPWRGFSAFQVFGDHVPMSGFVLVARIYADPAAMVRLLASRARDSMPLDPEVAMACIRAGLGLARSGSASFLYTNADETIALIRTGVVEEVGQSLSIHDQLVSLYAARLAMVLGEEVPVFGDIYEFPNLSVARRAYVTALEALEDSTPLRCSIRLGAQLQGRGEPFHHSMVETLEEQTALLEANGVDMESLPGWWWRGVAASVRADEIDVHEEIPGGDAFAELVTL